MIPRPEKREGWIIIELWRAEHTTRRLMLVSESLFETEERAREFLGPVDDFRIAKVEWEE